MAKSKKKEPQVTDLTRGVYRRIYSGFVKGQRINALSLEAEAWFWRFMAAADDFGNAEAEPPFLFSNTVGRRKGVTLDDVCRWFEECVAAKLLLPYTVRGERFYHVAGFTAVQTTKSGRRTRLVHPAACEDDDRRQAAGLLAQLAEGRAVRHADAVRSGHWRRRERLNNAPGTESTAHEWDLRVEYFCRCCAYCHRPCDDPTIDHIVPLSRGGSRSIDNLAPACRSCNSRKSNRSLLSFVCGEVR